MTSETGQRRVGLWLVGGRGAISTCVVYGLSALRRGALEPIGLATETEPMRGLDLPGFDELVLGGHDVCSRDFSKSAGELVSMGILDGDLVVASADEASAYEANLRSGPLDGPDVGMADLDPRSAELGGAPPRDQIAQLVADWQAFEEDQGLERTVVVLLSSTEAAREHQAEWDDLEHLEAALDEGREQPASLLYAYAALSTGRPFVNFTPNLGSSSDALRWLADDRGVPHAGQDGKTGETLVKTVLAPMFAARALKVLAWQGYNMLGNRDGEVLHDPAHRQAKLRNKDEVLRELLGPGERHTQVSIDYVPSLADWKTAWDFIHFEGFLGARMSLQFTWQGSDSALAAPLVIDLARLAAFAARAGEGGVMDHTACYFKAPLGGGTHDFHHQHLRLLEYAARHLKT
ncbi:MAG: inositol-3-phosphate synthase [Planctomycetota bacterium]|nr:inositol-3-phosphate synthase [Planctomycetota bacterium]